LVDHALGPVECVGAEKVATVVECREVLSESGGECGVGPDERAERVGFCELVPERLFCLPVAVLGDQVAQLVSA